MPVPGFQRPGDPVLDEGVGSNTPSTGSRAKAAISEAKGGGDPAAARDVYRKAPTIKQLDKRFLEEYVRNHCKPSTAYEYGRSVKLFIGPRIPDHHRGGLLCLSRRTGPC